MDRQARKLANQRGEDSEEEEGGSGNSDSDFEQAKENGVSGKKYRSISMFSLTILARSVAVPYGLTLFSIRCL